MNEQSRSHEPGELAAGVGFYADVIEVRNGWPTAHMSIQLCPAFSVLQNPTQNDIVQARTLCGGNSKTVDAPSPPESPACASETDTPAAADSSSDTVLAAGGGSGTSAAEPDVSAASRQVRESRRYSILGGMVGLAAGVATFVLVAV